MMNVRAARKIAFTILFALLSMHSLSHGKCVHTENELSCVEYVKNYDGDTITFNIKKVHPILGNEISVRVLGIDAPEIISPDPCAARIAVKSQREVQEILEDAHRLDLVDVRRGKYFRVVADVLFDGESLREHMLRKKLAVPYDGGHREEVDWCKL